MKRAREARNASDTSSCETSNADSRKLSDVETRGFREAVRHTMSAFEDDRQGEVNLLESAGISECPKYDKQIRAYAAAWACKTCNFPIMNIARAAGVSLTTLYNYIPKVVAVEERGVPIASVIKKCGRPTKYPLVVDASFIEWLESSERMSSERMTVPMLEQYKEKCEELKKEIPELEEESLNQHIQKVYRRKKWRMMNPKIVDAQRCAIQRILKVWYKDPLVAEVFKNAHPSLVYNADETLICQRSGRPGKSLSKNGKQPRLSVDNRSVSHVSLFAVVSASGIFMRPLFVIHGPPKKYLHDETVAEEVKTFYTETGYMNKDTFYDIITNHFIKQVERKREDLRSLGEPASRMRAVLVVDGHKSRYDPRVFKALRAANIDLVILPAHSSHLTQPLDLRLNAIIKNRFAAQWKGRSRQSRKWSESLIRVRDSAAPEEKEVEKPPKKRGRKKKEYKEKPPEETETEDVVLLVEEGPITISKAEYDRFLFLSNLRDAVVGIPTTTVVKSWEQSHLYPFEPTPPCSEEDQQDLERQTEAAGYKKGRRRAINAPLTIPLTGVVNSEKDKRLLEYLEETRVTVLPPVTRKKVRRKTSSETVEARHDEPEGDVGDAIVKLNRKKNMPTSQYGISDAAYIFQDDPADVTVPVTV